MKHFPAADWNPRPRDSYNRCVADAIDGVLAFLALHYRGAARSDNQHWRDAKTRVLPGMLTERIKLWEHRLPDAGSVFSGYHGFEPYSYTCMLLGLGGIPLRPVPAVNMLDDTAAGKEFQLVRHQSRDLTERLPSQYEYLHGVTNGVSGGAGG